MGELDDLIEAVEAGTLTATMCGQYGSGIAPFCNGDNITLLAPLNAYHGSLDAALALHKAVLPGWALERLNMWPGANGRCSADLWGTHERYGERWHNFKDGRANAGAATPARAWLLAILLAVRAQQ